MKTPINCSKETNHQIQPEPYESDCHEIGKIIRYNFVSLCFSIRHEKENFKNIVNI